MACKVCGKSFVIAKDLDSDAKPHVCVTCGKSFSLKIQLKRHILTHAGGAPYVCNSCEKKNINSNAMASYSKKSDKKSYECDVCGEEFSLKRLLKTHYLTHTSSDVHPCEICDEDFPSEALLDEHYFVHESRRERPMKHRKAFSPSAKLHVCKVCYKAYMTKASYEKHCESHEIDYSSEEDTKKISKKSNSVNPPKIIAKRKRSCRSDINYSENNLESASENESSGKRKKHTCEVCGCSFSRKSALDGHALVHLVKLDEGNNEELSDPEDVKDEEFDVPKSDNLLCNICGTSFTSKGKLKKHRKTHENKNSEVTDKQDNKHEPTMLEKMILKRDKRNKKFHCKSCKKDFKVENCYKKHLLRKHGHSKASIKSDVSSSNEQASVENTDEDEDFIAKKGKGKKKASTKADFTCEYCNENFSSKRGLFARHRLTHTPEVCGICDERFVDRESLREHCKSHIGTEEAKRFLECSQKHFNVKKSMTTTPEPKVEYIYLVIR